MELRDIEIFLTPAEELHFGRTAERLHITSSRVSHAIKKQERRIGARLFARTSRTVRLTPLGERLRDDLLPAHLQIQQAVDRAAAEARGITGTLRVGYSTPWCADLVLRAAESFRSRHRESSVRVQEIQFDEPIGPLCRGEPEAQGSELPVQEPGITTGPVLFRERRALLVADGHPLAGRDSLSLEDLADVPLVVPKGKIPEGSAGRPRAPTHPDGPPHPPQPLLHLLAGDSRPRRGRARCLDRGRARRPPPRPARGCLRAVPGRADRRLRRAVATAKPAPSVLAFVGLLHTLAVTAAPDNA
ncbi:LysR family transcriptional regulator [Streptomyces sp. NPDC057682]|uniref:LysR family transcriptional regulator n=1 Tax=Streptomyces sp. NPDC057682 TaxID=3346210 RepID=UPI0036823B9C